MAPEISADTDPIDRFKSWALQMGCPVNALPSDAALDRLMKSNIGNVQKLMERWKPIPEVKLCRDNLLVSSLSVSSALLEIQQTDQPNFLNNLKRTEKINRQIDELKPRVERLRTDVKDKKSSLFEKAEQLKVLKRKHRTTKSKSIQLEQKHAQLMEKIEVEKGFETILGNGMSVPNDVTTDRRNEAERAVKKSLKYLKSVYGEFGNRELTKADRDQVQREIMRTIAGIPVVTAYEAIKTYREMNVAQFNSNGQPAAVAIPSAFDVAITKSRCRMYIEHHLARKKLKDEYSARVDQYVQLYDQYLDQMINAMKSLNGSDVELFADDMCGDYLRQYGTSISNQSMLQFKRQKLSNLQQLAAERDAQLKGNDVVATELTNMYRSIETTYNSAYDDIVSLGDTNKSLKKLQALCIYTLNSFGHRSKGNTSTNLLNGTLGSVVSSMTSAEYGNEISLLVNLMNEQWPQLPDLMDVQCQRPNEAISPFYTLLTPNGTLNQLKKKWAWHKVIETLTQPLDVNKSVPQVLDAKLVSANLNAENAKIAKIMDEIRFMYQTGNETVANIRKYSQFLLDTSLGSLIPDRVMINRRSFHDYEEEFLCACSLIANSMKRN